MIAEGHMATEEQIEMIRELLPAYAAARPTSGFPTRCRARIDGGLLSEKMADRTVNFLVKWKTERLERENAKIDAELRQMGVEP
jgi:hypothetical protein